MELAEGLKINNAVTAAFNSDLAYGRIFMFNRSGWTTDDQAVAEIAAKAIGAHVQELALRGQLDSAAAWRERERLGRDLHDGLLQGLAAATLRIRALSTDAPAPLKGELDTLRSIVTDEAQKIRTFIDETRVREKPTTGLLALGKELPPLADRLRQRWGCEVTLTIKPPELECSLSTTRSIRHMVGEAVSNAVRHGRASSVDIAVSCRDEQVVLSVEDDGVGFVDLNGIYSQRELKDKDAGPFSLRSRVEELGGKLFLTSTPNGSNVTIEFPR
jgi:signal transduction histidine kinase